MSYLEVVELLDVEFGRFDRYFVGESRPVSSSAAIVCAAVWPMTFLRPVCSSPFFLSLRLDLVASLQVQAPAPASEGAMGLLVTLGFAGRGLVLLSASTSACSRLRFPLS